MTNINESKEALPVDFITQFISKGWDEIGSLRASIDGITQEFSGTAKVEQILKDFMDAYLIAIGQMENQLEKKINIPDKADLKEAVHELAEPITEAAALEVADPEKSEIFTTTPDYNVEIEQKGDKVEIELTPKIVEDNWPVPEQDGGEMAAAKAALANGEISIADQPLDKPELMTEPNGELETKNTKQADCDFFTDFDDPEPDEETDHAIKAWLNKE